MKTTKLILVCKTTKCEHKSTLQPTPAAPPPQSPADQLCDNSQNGVTVYAVICCVNYFLVSVTKM